MLPWGWQSAEPLLLCAIGLCDEALALSNTAHVNTHSDGRGIDEYSGGDEADEDTAAGVSIAEPLAEAGGIFFSFARSALSAVTTAVSSAAVHLNEGARVAAPQRPTTVDVGDSALRFISSSATEAERQLREYIETANSGAAASTAATSAGVPADGWDEWPEDAPEPTPPVADGQRLLAHGETEPVFEVSSLPTTMKPEETETEGWGLGDALEVDAALQHRPPSAAEPAADAPVVYARTHASAETETPADPWETDFALLVSTSQPPQPPREAFSTLQEAALADGPNATETTGWADAELELDVLPEVFSLPPGTAGGAAAADRATAAASDTSVGANAVAPPRKDVDTLNGTNGSMHPAGLGAQVESQVLFARTLLNCARS